MPELFGIEEEEQTETAETIEETKLRKRQFAYWTVGDKEYKLKLTTAQICKLEDKYRRNLLMLLTGGDIPPLSVMLTVIQAAADPWNSGTKNRDIQAAFDRYVQDGGTQLTLFAEVIVDGILPVSGFFTEEQQEEVAEKVKDAKELL